jgi:hypothetical protein
MSIITPIKWGNKDAFGLHDFGAFTPDLLQIFLWPFRKQSGMMKLLYICKVRIDFEKGSSCDESNNKKAALYLA